MHCKFSPTYTTYRTRVTQSNRLSGHRAWLCRVREASWLLPTVQPTVVAQDSLLDRQCCPRDAQQLIEARLSPSLEVSQRTHRLWETVQWRTFEVVKYLNFCGETKSTLRAWTSMRSWSMREGIVHASIDLLSNSIRKPAVHVIAARPVRTV